jgi:D-lactate dehydrogenase
MIGVNGGALSHAVKDLRSCLEDVVPRARVLTSALDRLAFANDASVYRMVPRGVVQPASVEEVQGLFRLSHRERVPLTFRAAGTSLSGQAVTDGVLVDVSRHWRTVEVLDDGAAVRVQPGAIAAAVNRTLAPHGAKIGPDPASIAAAMMGGVLANNSSGMCCGVELNAYHTLESMAVVLPDGTVVDSSVADAEARFAAESPQIARGLLELRDRVLADPGLCDRIRRKYRMKNTMGYSLNAFLDHTTPVAILSHLMIGSEGTLGFIAEAVLRTVPDYPLKHTGMLFFPDVPAACSAIVPLRESGARTLELMDRASLAAVVGRPGVPDRIPGLPPTAAALLLEYQESTDPDLAERLAGCHDLLPSLSLQSEPIFTRDPARQADLWAVRKGLIPSVGAKRERGTAMIIEDVVFPLEALAEGVRELQEMCAAHHYDDAIVFGHARDGNLHFVLNQRFDDPEAVRGFDGFMKTLADLVAVRYGGALKGEHSTGRNMAPFLALEWGPEALSVMRQVKALVDPEGLLNPGVLINDDPRAHITHLKSLEPVEEMVDPCIECGFCERLCPSRDLTRTPRQRIVLRREMTRLRREEPGSELLRELEREFKYSGLDTCAADGMCATGCPVGIDTGLLVKHLRDEGHPAWRRGLARTMARHFGAVERASRAGLRAAHVAREDLGAGGTAGLVRVARALGLDLPLGFPDLPRAAGADLPRTARGDARAVYLPSCVSRTLGPGGGDRPLAEVVVAVCARAGVPVWIPDGISEHCCGMPFGSKGYEEAARIAASRLVEAIWQWTDAGRLPVLLDTSPCAHTLRSCRPELPPRLRERHRRLEMLDGLEFALERVVPHLEVRRTGGRIALHPVCSTVKMGIDALLSKVVEPFCSKAVVPPSAGCCGFAGDRGYLVPELTAAATAAEAREIESGAFEGFYASSRTCEIGLTRATGRPYRSFWYLLEEATRPPEKGS